MLSSSSVSPGMNAGWLRPPGADRLGVERDTSESGQRSAGVDEEAVHGWRHSGRIGEIGRRRRMMPPAKLIVATNAASSPILTASAF
jgi:hypothetical protein